MKKYKALMLDLDGTTIPNSWEAMPSLRVKEAIAKANDYLSVGIVTARPPFWAKPVMKVLTLKAPCVVIGGARIIDPVSYKTLFEKVIPKIEAEQIIDMLKKNKIPFLYPRDTNDLTPTFDITIPDAGQIEIAVPEITHEQADFLLDKFDNFKNIAAHKVTGLEKDKVWLQITHLESTKQHSILKVAEILNIETHEIIGVGDSYNDFPLLMACGLKVAMGNAVQELKEIADYIAPSVEEDGVADVIEKFIL